MNRKSQEGLENAVVYLFLAFCMVVAIIMLTALVLFTIVGTIMSVIFWNRPLRTRWLQLDPWHCRWFIIRGLIGTAVVPALIWLTSVIFTFEVDWVLWPYFVGGGYVLGAAIIELFVLGELDPKEVVYEPARKELPVFSRPETPARKAEPPFRCESKEQCWLSGPSKVYGNGPKLAVDTFAAWDDRKEFGR